MSIGHLLSQCEGGFVSCYQLCAFFPKVLGMMGTFSFAQRLDSTHPPSSSTKKNDHYMNGIVAMKMLFVESIVY